MKIIDIKHEKGNFKFYSFNFSVKVELDNPDLDILEQVFNDLDEGKHINLIVYNKINNLYEDRIYDKIYSTFMERIARKMSQTKTKDNVNYFFAGPNMIFEDFIYEARAYSTQYGLENVYDKSRRDFKKYYSLYYYFCNYDSLYEIKNRKLDISAFNRIMDGFSKFHNSLINANKNHKFRIERKYFDTLKEFYQPLLLKYKEFNWGKSSIDNDKLNKQNLEITQAQLEKVMKNLEFLIKQNGLIKDYINRNKNKFISEPSKFFIPYRQDDTDGDKINKNYKTNICKNCQFNCHINCTDSKTKSCSIFDSNSNCKECPNKCPLSEHTIVKYELPKYEYKAFDKMFPNNLNDNNALINFAFECLEKENQEIKNKIDCIKEEIANIKKDKNKKFEINMKKINDELNYEVKRFESKYVYDLGVKESYEEELFKIFLFGFLKIDYIFEFTEDVI